jgi:uncharacterized membrane protein
MARVLAIAAIVWPTVLGCSLWQLASAEPTTSTALVYAAASHVCHQKPERSFHTAGVSWPVCARCSGLYLAAPMGACLALLTRRRGMRRSQILTWLAVACAPTAITFGAEMAGLASPSNLARAMAALPAGAAIAFTLVRTADGRSRAIE